MEHLAIKAGATARRILLERGLNPTDVRVLPSAASGPKWIVLYHLNRFLHAQWFPKDHPLELIGSSAGAWQMACAAQPDPGPAFDRLLKEYIEQTYPQIPTQQEVSDTCKGIIAALLGKDGTEAILNNTNRNLSVVTNRTLFEVIPEKTKRQFANVFLQNFISRKRLNRCIERNIFSTQGKPPIDLDRDVITTTRFNALTRENALSAITASGAIPTVMNPQVGITGDGHKHWDGALTDYHFGVPWKLEDGIILYTHYQSRIVPGWFDKHFPWRNAPREWMDRLVLLHPTKAFVEALPTKAIPNRKDFKTFFQRDAIRIKNWYASAELGKGLLYDFKQYIKQPIPEERVEIF